MGHLQGWLEDGRLRVLPSEMRRMAEEGPPADDILTSQSRGFTTVEGLGPE